MTMIGDERWQLPDDDTTVHRVMDDEDRVAVDWVQLIPQSVAVSLLYSLLRLRLVDERLLSLHRQGRITFHGSSFGQEVLPAVLGHVLQPSDWIVPGLRESGVLLERGMPLAEFLAQSFGAAIDPAKGRQMPNHQASPRLRVASWSSSIGSQLPHAVGLAWAAQYQKDPLVAVGVMGDGATSTGDFHAALNFAGVFRVPCILICQNNHYALSLPVNRQTGVQALAVKGRAYGLPSYRVDGNDALAVFGMLSELVRRVREGRGPAFVECLTYRLGPHSTSDDPSRYRSPEELAAWLTRDPLERLTRALRELGWVQADQVQAWRVSLQTELDSAIRVVEHAGNPPLMTLFDDVYAVRPWHLTEQRARTLAGPRSEGPGIRRRDGSG